MRHVTYMYGDEVKNNVKESRRWTLLTRREQILESCFAGATANGKDPHVGGGTLTPLPYR